MENGSDISLSCEDLELFIDVWEAHPGLWDAACKEYRNRMSRNAALHQIADTFDRGWSVEDVKRKLESLKSYRRLKKQKQESSSTGSTGGKRKDWVHFNRIHSFFGRVEYNGSTVTCSDTGTLEESISPSQLTIDIASTSSTVHEDECSPYSGCSADIQLLTDRIQAAQRKTDQQNPEVAGLIYITTPIKKASVRKQDPFQATKDAALGFRYHLTREEKPNTRRPATQLRSDCGRPIKPTKKSKTQNYG